jgi:hypothetical protein
MGNSIKRKANFLHLEQNRGGLSFQDKNSFSSFVKRPYLCGRLSCGCGEIGRRARLRI